MQSETQPETPSETQTLPETQQQTTPNPEKRKHKKKDKAKQGKVTKKCTTWTSQEEVWLTQCWLDSSEDSRRGNSQKRTTLWHTIYNKFNNNNFGWYRGDDQLSSKWRNINKFCGEFNSVYNEVRRNWRSGEGDDDILTRAQQQYKNNFLRKFNMMDCWYVLKDKPKWYSPPPVGGDDDECKEEFVVRLSADNELFGDDPFERPPGRDKSKKAARTSQSSDAPTSSSRGSRSSKTEEFMENMTKFKEDMTETRKQTLAELKRHENLRTAFAGASILTMNTDEVKNKKDRRYIEKLKILYRKNFGNLIESDSDDESDENEDN